MLALRELARRALERGEPVDALREVPALRDVAALRDAVALRACVLLDALERRVREDPVRRRPPFARWLRGTSALTTAVASRGISFSRNPRMRSSSRRISRASFTVSRSPSDSATEMIAV